MIRRARNSLFQTGVVKKPSARAMIVVFSLLIPAVVRAQWFGDFYLGFTRTHAGDNRFTLNGVTVRELRDTDQSSPFGGRLGYWFRSPAWLGVALDMSVLTPDFNDASGPPLPGSPVTVTVVPISGLLLIRLPLEKSEDFPNGRLQPYLGGGPGIFYTSLSEFAGNTVAPPAVLEDSSWTLGYDARAGITGLIRERLGLFLESRYTRVRPRLESRTGGGQVQYVPTFRTYYVVLGVTFRG